MDMPVLDSGSPPQCEGNAPLGGTNSYTSEDLANIEKIKQSLMRECDAISHRPEENLKRNNHHHDQVQCNSHHAAHRSPSMSRDESTQKIFTTLTPMQPDIGNKPELVKPSHLTTYYTIQTPDPNQTIPGGGVPVRVYKTQNFCSAAPSIESQSNKRNNPYEDLPETSSQNSNDKQSKQSLLEQYRSILDNVKCILMIDFFRVVPLEKIRFEDNDALKTFAPIAPNLLDHNTPIYAKLVHSEQHNSSNLVTWIVINGEYFCNRWHYSSQNYTKKFVFNCAGVENKNHGGKRTKGENGGKTYKVIKCKGSIWIEVDEEKKEMIIGKKKDHTNEHCLRNLFKIFHDDCRHMACKNESMEGAIEEFKKLLQDLKNHLQNKYQLNVSSPSNEEADKEDYFTYKKSVKANSKSADLQFFERVFKIDQKSTNRNQVSKNRGPKSKKRRRPINQPEFRVKIMNITERASTSTKANDSATPIEMVD